jgi:hypothetical protein
MRISDQKKMGRANPKALSLAMERFPAFSFRYVILRINISFILGVATQVAKVKCDIPLGLGDIVQFNSSHKLTTRHAKLERNAPSAPVNSSSCPPSFHHPRYRR